MSSGAPPPDWSALYQKHRDAMWKAAGRLLREAGRHSETADVVHAAMVSLISAVPDGVENWEALMVKTATRRATDLIRSARVRHDGGGLDESHTGRLATDQFIAEDVADAVDHERAGAIVREALGSLDPRDRQIVWGRFVHERTGRELAEHFGLSEGRVSQIVKSALARLRTELQLNGIEGW